MKIGESEIDRQLARDGQKQGATETDIHTDRIELMSMEIFCVFQIIDVTEVGHARNNM